MKAYLWLGTIALFSPFLHASTAWDRTGRYDDGFTAAHFESQETHGYFYEHRYDREDEGITEDSRNRYSRDRYGYTWESTHQFDEW